MQLARLTAGSHHLFAMLKLKFVWPREEAWRFDELVILRSWTIIKPV